MLKEIMLPEDYSGSLEQENDIVSSINENFKELEGKIDSALEERIEFTEHIIDFEEYRIDLYYSENKKKATVSLQNDIITVEVNGKEIRIDSNGDII